METQEYWSRYQKATPAWEFPQGTKAYYKDSNVGVRTLRSLKSKNLYTISSVPQTKTKTEYPDNNTDDGLRASLPKRVKPYPCVQNSILR